MYGNTFWRAIKSFYFFMKVCSDEVSGYSGLRENFLRRFICFEHGEKCLGGCDLRAAKRRVVGAWRTFLGAFDEHISF